MQQQQQSQLQPRSQSQQYSQPQPQPQPQIQNILSNDHHNIGSSTALLEKKLNNLHPYYKKMIENPWEQLTKNNPTYKRYREALEEENLVMTVKYQKNEQIADKIDKSEIRKQPIIKKCLRHYTIEQKLLSGDSA